LEKRYILFDLDGTLTDPGEGITNSVAYSLKKYGIDVADRTSLYKFIGPPLYESYEVYYGFSHEKAEEAVAFYREYYRDKGIYENRVYDGIREMLTTLDDKGYKLVLATSKPEHFAKIILDHFDLSGYFTEIAGADMAGDRVKKSDVIAYALEKCGAKAEECIMVGDREHDVLGSAEFDIPCIGVLFGYGSREELEGCGAKWIAESAADITKIILGLQ
jgi:phosphoglycolate phosphatase